MNRNVRPTLAPPLGRQEPGSAGRRPAGSAGSAGSLRHAAARRSGRLLGFTLLEVMIVVGMAALVMAVSVPFVQRTIRRDAVYQAVQVVLDACRNARTLAIVRNVPMELIIRPKDKEFSVRPGAATISLPPRVSAPAGDSEPVPAAPSASDKAAPYSGSLGEDVTIELLDVNFTEFKDAEETKVRFHPNGTSDEFTIVLRIGASAWRKISLEIVTGIPTLEVMR